MGGMLRVAIALLVLSAAGLPALAPQPAFACSCVADWSVRTHFEMADAVFAGRVTQVEGEPYRGSHLAVRLEVSRAWKGSAGKVITVLTSDGGGDACAYDFAVGTDYVIYAHTFGGALDVNSCGRTHPGGPTADGQAVFGTELPVEDPPTEQPSKLDDDLSSTSSALHLVLIFGAPLVLAAMIAAAVVWWRTARR